MSSILNDNQQTSNPAPLGLYGFGMTTILLNIHNAGLFKLDAMVLAMGIFIGGIAQLIAGILEAKKNNTFGLTAFVLYGGFWFTLVAMILMQKTELIEKVTPVAMCCFLSVWGLITVVFLIGSLRISKGLTVVFLLLTLLFCLLATAEATGKVAIKTFAGYEGILCGFSAVYLSAATLLRELGFNFLPIGIYDPKKPLS